MHDAVLDGVNHPMVLRLNMVPTGQHAHTGFMERLEKQTGVLDHISPIPDLASAYYTPHSAVIRSIYKHYPTEFDKRLGANPDRVHALWAGFYSRYTRE